MSVAADALETYLATTSFDNAPSTLSSGRLGVNSSVPGLAEAMSIDFKLDQGAFANHPSN